MQAEFVKRSKVRSETQRTLEFVAVLIVVVAVLFFFFNLISDGVFLSRTNLTVILSHTIYPTFIAWGFCFLFACGYTDLSIGGIMVLGSFASCVFGNWYGYPGVILGGLIVGTLLVFINFNIFAFTKIPSWIAGISLAMIYEAIAVFLKVGKNTKPLIDTALDKEFRALGHLPWSIIILAVGFIAVFFVFNRTTIGLNIRALGSNKEVAKALGIDINRTLQWVGLICGILIGIACILQQSYSGRTTVKTGLTSINMIFQPLAIVLLAQIMQKRINIVIAVPICAFIIYAVFNLLTVLGVPSGTLQEAFLGTFLIIFGVIGQRNVRGVVK
ncbi:MAG: hypothetical protein GX847_10405 [Clostridiales bacterium]|nr:hypothetical protein [Clostridiales bacterium]